MRFFCSIQNRAHVHTGAAVPDPPEPYWIDEDEGDDEDDGEEDEEE